MTKSKAATSLTAGAIFGAVARACVAAAGRTGWRLYAALYESREREAARILRQQSNLIDTSRRPVAEPRREETARRKATPRRAKVLRLSFLIPLAAVAALAALATKGEGAVTDDLLARAEYLGDDYGHKDYTGVASDIERVSLTGKTLRGALVWKFTPTARVQ